MSSHNVDLSREAQELDLTFHRFRSALAQLRVRVRMGMLLEAVAVVAIAFAAYFVVTWPIDRWFRLNVPVRAVILIAFATLTLRYLIQRILAPMAQDLDDEELALAVERANKPLGQRLISALQFQERFETGRFGGDSPVLMQRVVAELPSALGDASVSAALRGERIRKGFLGLGIGAGFLLLVGLLYPGFGLWAKRNLMLSAEDWPRETHLSVLGTENGRLVVPRGDDFTVEVEAKGVAPEQVLVRYRFDDGGGGREPMTKNVGAERAVYSYTFPGLMDPVRFYAYGGDGITREIEVVLVDRPVLERETLRLVYPEYMNRKPQEVAADATETLLPRGTRIEYEGYATKKLREAELAVGDDLVAKAEVAEDQRTVRGTIEPKESGLFLAKLVDVDGLTQGPGRRLMLRVVPDKAPRLIAKIRGLGAWITRKARIPVELSAIDDFGLDKLEMLWGVGDRASIGADEELIKSYKIAKAEGLERFEPGKLVYESLVRHDLMPLIVNDDDPKDPKNPVRPGQFVAVRFRARDNNRKEDPEGQLAVSESFTFKVVTESELLRELGRRQNELRVQFEKYIKKEIADRAEFGELQSPKTAGQIGAQVRNRISTMARTQRAMAKRVSSLGRRYGQILDEMINNRVADGIGGEGRVRSLRGKIVDALDQLGTSAIPTLAGLIARYGRDGDDQLRLASIDGYNSVIRAMQRVLREMQKLESFTQILTDLKELIRLEGMTAEETKRKLKADLEGVFKKGGDAKKGGDGK